MGQGSHELYTVHPERSKFCNSRHALRIAITSACAVGSLFGTTRFAPFATTLPSRTITAPNGPPPSSIFSMDSSIAILINSLSSAEKFVVSGSPFCLSVIFSCMLLSIYLPRRAKFEQIYKKICNYLNPSFCFAWWRFASRCVVRGWFSPFATLLLSPRYTFAVLPLLFAHTCMRVLKIIPAHGERNGCLDGVVPVGFVCRWALPLMALRLLVSPPFHFPFTSLPFCFPFAPATTKKAAPRKVLLVVYKGAEY